jgi:hypothetical protein
MLSHRRTTYPDSFFYPIHYGMPLYQEKVLSMFKTDPPVSVYSTDCNVVERIKIVYVQMDKIYTRLFKNGKPSCIYVRNDRLAKTLSTLKSRGFSK